MQASGDVAASRRRKRDEPPADADMRPQPSADGEWIKKDGKNAAETGEKAARATRAFEQPAAVEKVHFVNCVPSVFGRHDAQARMRRIETVVAKVQSANATIAGRLVALEHVERSWFQATRAVTETSVATISSMAADMRRENENFQAKMNEDCRATLTLLQRQTDEAQRATARVQEACALFKVALARFKEQQERWIRCASQARVEGESTAREKARMDRCWCAVEAAIAGMGEEYLPFTPVVRQMVAQVEWAVQLGDVTGTPLGCTEADAAAGDEPGVGSRSGREGPEGDRARADMKGASWSQPCCRAAQLAVGEGRPERRSLRRRRWKRRMRAMRGKGASGRRSPRTTRAGSAGS